MVDIRDLRLQRQRELETREPARNVFRAVTCYLYGSLHPPNRPDSIYVTKYGQPVLVVSNTLGITEAGVAVMVGPDPKPPYGLAILALARTGVKLDMGGGDYVGSGIVTTSAHHTTHEYRSEGSPGSDPVLIYQPAIQTLKTVGNGTDLTVTVLPHIYRVHNVRKYFPGIQVDLTSYLPAAGNYKRVLLCLNTESNVLTVVSGDEVPTTSAIEPPYPDIPWNARASAFVLLTGGQTYVSTSEHIEDARDLLGVGRNLSALRVEDLSDVDSTGLADGYILTYDAGTNQWLAIPNSPSLSLDDISDVTITSAANGEVLVYQSGTWVNEVVNAVQLQARNIAVTAPNDGDGLVWNSGANQWEPGTIGGSSDADAIHDNVAAEISLLTEKTTPVSGDLLLMEDSEDAYNKKKVQMGNLPGGGGGGNPQSRWFAPAAWSIDSNDDGVSVWHYANYDIALIRFADEIRDVFTTWHVNGFSGTQVQFDIFWLTSIGPSVSGDVYIRYGVQPLAHGEIHDPNGWTGGSYLDPSGGTARQIRKVTRTVNVTVSDGDFMGLYVGRYGGAIADDTLDVLFNIVGVRVTVS